MRWLLVGLTTAAILTLAIVALRAQPSETPTADRALTELYTIRAARLELKVGAYSRFGWNHPGPLFFYLAAPLYAASGRRFAAIELTALMINLVSVIGLGLLVRTQASSAFALGVLAALSLYLLRFGQLLTNPWNPYIAILPLGLLIIASAAFAGGRLTILPVIGLLFSFVVQSHAAFAVPASGCVAACAVLFALANKGALRERRQTSIRIAVVSAAVIAIVWLPPFIDQVGSTGQRNIGQLTKFFFATGAPRHRLGESAAAFAHEFTATLQPGYAATEQWIHTIERETKSSRAWQRTAWVELVLVLAAAAAAFLKGRMFEAACCAACCAASVAAVAGIMQIRGPIEHYLVFWSSLLGTLVFGALAGLILAWLMPGSTNRWQLRLRFTATALVT